MSAKRGTFLNEDNPALQFISQSSIEAVEGHEQEEAPAPVDQAPHRKRTRPEAKSRRVQVLMKPSQHDALKALATREGISVNEAINEAIEDYLAREV